MKLMRTFDSRLEIRVSREDIAQGKEWLVMQLTELGYGYDDLEPPIERSGGRWALRIKPGHEGIVE